MTIYVVTSGTYSDYGINAMFSTKTLAEEWIAKLEGSYDIEEWELDAEKNSEPLTLWQVIGKLSTGEVTNTNKYERLVAVRHNGKATNTIGDWCTAESHDSEEHAKKLFIEACQARRREKVL